MINFSCKQRKALILSFALLTQWAGLDSNQRKEDLLDLQSSHFNRLSTYPIFIVARTGFEPVNTSVKSWRLRPLVERAIQIIIFDIIALSYS